MHKNILYHNRGDGTFEDVTAKAHIDQTNGHYCFSVSTLDYDDDGWPDIYVACDSTPSILYHNNHDGTFTDVAVIAGAAFNEDGREQAGMGSTVATTTATASSTSSKPTSPTTPPRSTTTMATALSTT